LIDNLNPGRCIYKGIRQRQHLKLKSSMVIELLAPLEIALSLRFQDLKLP